MELLKKSEPNHIDIARVIGIFLVIFGHFPFTPEIVFWKNIVYTFHMPLFFVISGFLHKQEQLSITSFKKIVFSLVIPYIIYNILYIIPFLFISDTHDILIKTKSVILLREIPNAPTWFFIILFFVKLIGLYFKTEKQYLVVSASFIVLFFIQSFFSIPNIFLFKTLFLAFPFYILGFMLKKIPLFKHQKTASIILFLCSLVLIYTFTIHYGRVDMYAGITGNLFFYFPVASMMSISVLYISQYIPLKNNFIKTISRGTMLIVGTHWFITDIVKYFYPNINLLHILSLTLIITLLYYMPIHYTFNRLPLLYGKTNQSRKKS